MRKVHPQDKLPYLIKEHGFALQKGPFQDSLCLKYNWLPNHLPHKCICGKALSVEHALSCPTGEQPAVRHNELRDFTAKVFKNV